MTCLVIIGAKFYSNSLGVSAFFNNDGLVIRRDVEIVSSPKEGYLSIVFHI